MLDIMTTALERLTAKRVAYADIRHEVRFATQLTVVNGAPRTFTRNNYSGTVARVLMGECWGQSSTTEPVTLESLDEILETSLRMARSSAKFSRNALEISVPNPRRGSFHQSVKEKPRGVPDEEKLRLVMDLDRAQKTDDRIVNTNSVYADSERVYRMVNTAGSSLEWDEIRTVVSVQPVAREGSRTEFDFGVESGLAGFELARGTDPNVFAAKAGRGAVSLLSADKPPSGELTVVMDSDICGVIAHEVCGHASEADEVVKKRSFLTGLVGSRVASDNVSLLDDATRPGLTGSIPFDSEGTQASKTYIIRNGVYAGYLHTLETSSIMGVVPTGNGRAQDFNHRVFARMTNTFFGEGDWKNDEIVEDTRNGLYVSKATSGMEDVVGGGVQASALKGYLIRNGQLGELVRGMTLTGRVLDMLKTVDAVGNTLGFHGGTCGKGEEDFVSVSTGGPNMRAKIVVGGG
jgi:TldD protein